MIRDLFSRTHPADHPTAFRVIRLMTYLLLILYGRWKLIHMSAIIGSSSKAAKMYPVCKFLCTASLLNANCFESSPQRDVIDNRAVIDATFAVVSNVKTVIYLAQAFSGGIYL
jgi:hypothetical protein